MLFVLQHGQLVTLMKTKDPAELAAFTCSYGELSVQGGYSCSCCSCSLNQPAAGLTRDEAKALCCLHVPE